MNVGYLIAALAAVPASSPAQPQNPVAEAVPKPPMKSDLDKVVCRTQEEIGSRLQSHKVCMTNEQWKMYAQQYKDQVQEVQSQASVRGSN